MWSPSDFASHSVNAPERNVKAMFCNLQHCLIQADHDASPQLADFDTQAALVNDARACLTCTIGQCSTPSRCCAQVCGTRCSSLQSRQPFPSGELWPQHMLLAPQHQPCVAIIFKLQLLLYAHASRHPVACSTSLYCLISSWWQHCMYCNSSQLSASQLVPI